MAKTVIIIYTSYHLEKYFILLLQWWSYITSQQTLSGITLDMLMILNGMQCATGYPEIMTSILSIKQSPTIDKYYIFLENLLTLIGWSEKHRLNEN